MTIQWNHVTRCFHSANTELTLENISTEAGIQRVLGSTLSNGSSLSRRGREEQWAGLPLTLTWRLFPGWILTLLVSSRCQCPEETETLSAKAPASEEIGWGVWTSLRCKWHQLHLPGRAQQSNAMWLSEKTNSISHISQASLENSRSKRQN